MKREAILDAAEQVLCHNGAQALTLAAVAKRAGVSKGGLLYHFPTKEALLKGLVARVIEEFDARVASSDDGDPGSYSRAFVEATFAILTGSEAVRTRRRWAGIMAAAEPELTAPLREAMTRWHGRDPGEDADPVTATVVRLAAEGLWEVVAHDPEVFDAERFAALRERLLALLRS